MNIEQAGNKLRIKCSYNPDHISRFRGMGGKWTAPHWEFPATSAQMLRDYIHEEFGLGEPDTLIQVPCEWETGGQAGWKGYVLASRRFRDYSVQLVDSTGCDKPFSSSGGSQKNPRVNVPDGALFNLMVPSEFAARHGFAVADVKDPTKLAPRKFEIPELKPNPLAQFSAEQLLDELARRGITAPMPATV